MINYTLFNWALLIFTFGLLIYLGYLSSKHLNKTNEAGFLVAGRSLGAFVSAGTIVATGFSGWGFMGSPGVTYQFGAIEVLGNFFFAPAMMIAVLYFACFLQRRAVEMGSNTIPEYIAHIHGSGSMARVLQGGAAFITILLLLVFLTSQIKAVGLLSANWLGIELNQSAFLMVSVIIIYTMLGGLVAVAWTDTVMVCGMALGFVRKVGSQATVDARHAYHRLKATCQLFIACGDAATFFKPAKAAFYSIPLTIFGFIEPSG